MSKGVVEVKHTDVSALLNMLKPKVPGFEVTIDSVREQSEGCKVRIALHSGTGRDMIYWVATGTIHPADVMDEKSIMMSAPFRDLLAMVDAFDAVKAEHYERGKLDGMKLGRELFLEPLRAIGAALSGGK